MVTIQENPLAVQVVAYFLYARKSAASVSISEHFLHSNIDNQPKHEQ